MAEPRFADSKYDFLTDREVSMIVDVAADCADECAGKIGVLRDQIARSDHALSITSARMRHYRRQRNVLIGVLTSIAVRSYLNARERSESRRVNPENVDYTGRM